MVHAGEETPALDLARRVIDVFELTHVDVVITNAGGCGSNVREYGYQLRDDPQYAERAARFSAKCKDVCEFLEELSPQAARKPVNMRVAYHDSCHLATRAAGPDAAPRTALRDPWRRDAGSARIDSVLRLGGHLQSSPAGYGRRAGGSQGAAHHHGPARRRRHRQRRMHAANRRRTGTPRTEDAGDAHHPNYRRVHKRPADS